MTDEGGENRSRFSPPSFGWGLVLRFLAVALVDALVVLAIPVLIAEQSWLLLTLLGVAALIFNWAFLSPRAQAMKWLAPGLILLTLFVVFPVVYTAYVSVTNWATGNVLSKDQVIDQLESQVIRTEGEGVSLSLSVYRDPEERLAFLVTDPEGNTYFGLTRARTDEPLEDPLLDPAALGADVSGEPPEQIGEFTKLDLRSLFALAGEIETMILDVPGVGLVQAQTTTRARLIEGGRRYIYDPEADAVYDAAVDATCVAEVGNFVCPDGRRISPGWREVIGLAHYQNILTNQRVRQPFLQVFTWNVVFAGGTVLLTFAVGLALALALQDERLRGRAIYRSIYIIPYAIPAFLSILVWRGLLNQQFGQVNRLLDTVGIDAIPWLSSPFWAKVAVLMVNTWLGFPYMFLVVSGALTSIPKDLIEAARCDGASSWRVLRTITLPLLLVSTAPLLIGSFAFNFNNFVLIFLLTDGGPPVVNAAVPVGETDILISFTFDLAVSAGRGNNFALGSAIVVMIFVIVAVISAISFRFTRRLEDIYGGV